MKSNGLIAGMAAVSLGLMVVAPVTAMDDAAPDIDASGASALHIDLTYHRLDNGLRVVLAEDHTVPTATVAVYYGVGFRTEPRGRTGFAHLFEHIFFEGSERMGSEGYHSFISGLGGVANGSTRLDYTNYYEIVPANALEAMLWAEAGRMEAPVLSQDELDHQRDVVRNEIHRNVDNQPYGGWDWIDLPMAANENWHNAHNFYGELRDLDAATLEEAEAFFDAYYRPSNAVLVVAGAFDSAETLGWIEREFGPIPDRPAPPEIDVSEPRQNVEKFAIRPDVLAPQPAVTMGYHMPERGSPEYYAMILIDQMLLAGDDAHIRRRLVDVAGYASQVGGGINRQGGNRYNYDGPMLWAVSVIHGADVTRDQVVAQIDREIDRLRSELVDPDDLSRARAKLLVDLYADLDDSTRFGLVDLLAAYALFDDDPGAINQISARIAEVTPELVLATAQEYLRPSNRTILEVVPVEAPADTETATEGAPK